MEWTEIHRSRVRTYFDLLNSRQLELESGGQWDSIALDDLAEGLFLVVNEHYACTRAVNRTAWAHFVRVVREMCRRRPKGAATEMLRMQGGAPGLFTDGMVNFIGGFASEAYLLDALERRLGYERTDKDGEPSHPLDDAHVVAMIEVISTYPKLVYAIQEFTYGTRPNFLSPSG